MQASTKRVLGRINQNQAVFLECDIQEKMRNFSIGFDSVAHNSKRLA